MKLSAANAGDRARVIDQAIAGMTILKLLERNARQHGDRPALFWREGGGGWGRYTWAEYRQRAAEVAMGLRSLGVGRGDFVALMGSNRPEHLLADLGALMAGATPVTLYSTLATPQIGFVAGHCQARVAIIEDRAHLARWEPARSSLPGLQQVVLMEGAGSGELSFEALCARGRAALQDRPQALQDTLQEVGPDDTLTLIYTSGTTGDPKGVVISHRNVLWAIESMLQTIVLPDHPRVVSYLPLAHIAERMASHYLGIWRAGEVYTCRDMTDLVPTVQRARPQLFVGVPRVWEKMHAALISKVDSEPGRLKRRLARGAISAGVVKVRHQQVGLPVSTLTQLWSGLAERLVLSKIRAGLGMSEVRLAVSTAAPISPDVLFFMKGIGLPIVELYGMSECTGPATSNLPERNRIGSVGIPFPGVEIAVADDGEVMIRGGHVASGYYRNPEATAETFTEDGWIRSGDLGQLDREGFLSIIGRKKEIIITAGGKNVAPAAIEGLLKQHPLIGNACVVGDQRRYLTALITLASETAPEWAAAHGLPYQDLASFSHHPRVRQEIDGAVEEANRQVSRLEQIKRFSILPVEWTPDGGELTPTLKLRRREITSKYQPQIEEMYAV